MENIEHSRNERRGLLDTFVGKTLSITRAGQAFFLSLSPSPPSLDASHDCPSFLSSCSLALVSLRGQGLTATQSQLDIL